ncbi:hypothetical protein G9A89_017775 [Geosiphon pyriformis]|nr:hypothetical protein G9A89_017775 [Geosiphon pyriformis]
MKSGSNTSAKTVESRKKKRGGALEDSIGNRKIVAKSNNVDMEKKFLVKKTSFNYGESEALAKKNSEQMPKDLKILTKRALGKPLGKINFLDDNGDNILLDTSLMLSSLLKILVNVSVRKLFALDIGLNKVSGKSSQKKLSVVKKLFSVIFTFKLDLMKATKKTTSVKILVNTNFKKFTGCSDQTVVLKKIPVGTSAEAVHAALSKFGSIKLIKMQLVKLWQKVVVEFDQIAKSDVDKELWNTRDVHKALLYILPMETNAHNI